MPSCFPESTACRAARADGRGRKDAAPRRFYEELLRRSSHLRYSARFAPNRGQPEAHRTRSGLSLAPRHGFGIDGEKSVKPSFGEQVLRIPTFPLSCLQHRVGQKLSRYPKRSAGFATVSTLHADPGSAPVMSLIWLSRPSSAGNSPFSPVDSSRLLTASSILGSQNSIRTPGCCWGLG